MRSRFPSLVMPGGYARRQAHIDPNFNPTISMRDVTKSTEPVNDARELVNIMRRAFSEAAQWNEAGRCWSKSRTTFWDEEVPDPLTYKPVVSTRSGPDPDAVKKAVDLLLESKRPVIYAGQGIHYAKAWPQLKELAEHLGIPVSTSLEGKSAFPEDPCAGFGLGRRGHTDDDPAFPR